MKKIFTLIAAALCSVSLFAEEVTNLDDKLNCLYVTEGQTVSVGNNQTFTISLKNKGLTSILSVDEIVLPAGMTFVKASVINKAKLFPYVTAMEENDDGEEVEVKKYLLTLECYAKEGRVLINGFVDATLVDKLKAEADEKGTEPPHPYYQGSGEILKITVNVTSEAAETSFIKLKTEEISFASGAVAGTDYVDTHGFGYEKYDEIVGSVTVTGGTGVNNVAADGTEATAVAKKIVDGKLVIVKGDAEFSAAGAQVK